MNKPILYKLANDFGINPMNVSQHNPALIYVKNIKLNRARELLARRRLLRRKNILKSRPLLDIGIHKAFNPDTGEVTYDYNSWKKLHNPTGDPGIDQRLNQDWIDTQKARAKYWGEEYEPGVQYTIPVHALGLPRFPQARAKSVSDFKYLYSPELSYTYAGSKKIPGRLTNNLGSIMHLLDHDLTNAPIGANVSTNGWILNPYFLGSVDAVEGKPLKSIDSDARPFLEKQRIFDNIHHVYPPEFWSKPTFLELLAMQRKDPNITIVTLDANPQNYYNSMAETFSAMRGIKASLAKLGYPYKQAAGKLPILKLMNAMQSAGLWKNTGITDYSKLAHKPAIHAMYKDIPGHASINHRLRLERNKILNHFNRYIFLHNKPNKTPNLLKLLDRYKLVLPVLIETGKTKSQQNKNYVYS